MLLATKLYIRFIFPIRFVIFLVQVPLSLIQMGKHFEFLMVLSAIHVCEYISKGT